jgi:hypothetical protein
MSDMSRLPARYEIRWSQLEARKPYARPFGVFFADDKGLSPVGLAVDGADLLFYEQFRVAVLAMLGEIFSEPRAEASEDVQRAWLDVISELLPDAALESITPIDAQDELRGMHYRFVVRLVGVDDPARLEAEQVLDYQLFQAIVAHQTGRVLRDPGVEGVADSAARRRLWAQRVHGLLQR